MKQTVICVHIPKTAGTTLRIIAERQYPAKGCYEVDGVAVQADIQRLRQLPEAEKKEFDLIYGHGTYGLHAHWPQAVVYFTMLREPIERCISDYHFLLQTPHHFAYEQVVGEGMDLATYVRSQVNKTIDNGQVRILSGAGTDPGFGQCTPAMLAQAKQNLRERIAVVGLTEQFEASIVLMQMVLGWRLPVYTRRNVTRQRPLATTLAPEARQLLQSCNVYDNELYQFAQTLFAQRWAADEVYLKRQLRRLQVVNPVYNWWWQGKQWGRGLLRRVWGG